MLVLFLLFLNLTPLFASNFTSTLRSDSTTIEPGQEFVVSVNISGANRLEAFEGNFSFDSSRLQLVRSELLISGQLEIGTRLVARFNSSRSGTFTAARITFRARAAFNVGDSTTISFTSVMGSDGTSDFSGTNSSTTITMVPARSSNNFLSSLTLSAGTLNFSRNTTSYTVDVDNVVSSITINATTEDARASISGLGTFPLNVYENTFNLVITAENGSRRTITLTIRRRDEQGNPVFLSSSTDINSLSLSACEISFTNALDRFVCEVRNDVNQTNVVVTRGDSTQRIEAPTQVSLNDGVNVIEVRIIAQNNDVRIITIEVTRRNDIFFVPLSRALVTLEQISNPILGVVLIESTTIPANVLNEVKRLGKKILVSYKDSLILLAPTSPQNEDLTLAFREFTTSELARFNFAIGQFVGLSVPLPSSIIGSWWIREDLQQFELNVFALDDPATPLRLASNNGVIEVSDVTQPLFITPASFSSSDSLMLILPALTALAGLLIGAILMALVKRRR